MSKFTLFLGRSLWNAIGVAVTASIAGGIVYFGNKYMLNNTPETAIQFLIMFLTGIGFLTFFFLVREYVNDKYEREVNQS